MKVPEMAESITEGTLKQFSKQVGDYVEQDEEIATIETDKVGCVLVLVATSLTPCSIDRCRCQRPRSWHHQRVPR